MAYFGVLAYEVLNLSTYLLAASALACWFLPAKYSWAHLALTVANRLIWCAVATRLDLMPKRIDTAFFAIYWVPFLPLLLSDIMTIFFKSPYRPKTAAVVLYAAVLLSPVAAWALAPPWATSVRAKFVESARVAAGEYEYCFSGRDLTIEKLVHDSLSRSVLFRIDPEDFYALIYINTGEWKYWSFKRLSFLPVPRTFAFPPGMTCAPETNPLAE